MAGASREEVYDVPAEKFYAAITDYASYPEILGEVDEVKVLDSSETSARIQYTINIVKSFSYVLKMTQKRPELVAWALESGSIFKVNQGSWKITPQGPNSCKVQYELEVDLKVFAPKAITNKLVSVNLPRMMNSFYEKAKGM
ncbi:type II toxin-antitoxin system RatA family toxin [Oligoflexus tunisiensis]|uniref:type II toxin-antitoxin system RatA family toxin n=1 Tax=Oligoflexus tunisiensis TaxID=708132 RepID=UPI00159F2520|nr:SRPBCC family protein [Oligoflexus tunisiensis]